MYLEVFDPHNFGYFGMVVPRLFILGVIFLGFFPGLDDGPISRLTIAYGRVEGYRYGTPHAPQGFFKTLSLDIFVSIALPRMSGRSQSISNVSDSWILLERVYSQSKNFIHFYLD